MDARLSAAFTGGLFGSALTLSGVAAPQAIIGQFQMSDFNMLLTFLSASACGAPIFALANRSEHARIPARPNSAIGFAGRFDGNVVGGVLLGLGMGLTGACPGTVLVQVVAGAPNSRLLLASAALAGLVYARWSQIRPTRLSDGKQSLSETTGFSLRTIILSYETALLAMIAIAGLLAPQKSPSLVHPILGGILIGVAQAASVYLSKKALGVSTAYEDVGKMFWGVKAPVQNLIFAAGIMAGARVTMHVSPTTALAFASSPNSSPLTTILGGFLLVLGARIAGGCTSGHGISGMSTFGLSSFITVPCMFAGGILAAWLSR